MLTDFTYESHLLTPEDNYGLEDIPEFYDKIQLYKSKVSQVYFTGTPSERLFHILHTLFTYTNVKVQHLQALQGTRLKHQSVLLLSAYTDMEPTLYWLSKFTTRGFAKETARRIVWVDVPRAPRNTTERNYLENVFKFCDIVTYGGLDLEESLQDIVDPTKTITTSIEDWIPPVPVKEPSLSQLEASAKEPLICWTGNVYDMTDLVKILPEIQYPLKFVPKDFYSELEHPKLDRSLASVEKAIGQCQFILITIPPSDPYFKFLVTKALLGATIPVCIGNANDTLDTELNDYILYINSPSKVSREILSDFLFTETRMLYTLLQEGQEYLEASRSVETTLDAVIDVYKACETLLETKQNLT